MVLSKEVITTTRSPTRRLRPLCYEIHGMLTTCKDINMKPDLDQQHSLTDLPIYLFHPTFHGWDCWYLDCTCLVISALRDPHIQSSAPVRAAKTI